MGNETNSSHKSFETRLIDVISHMWTNASQIHEAVLQYLEDGHLQLTDSCGGSLIAYRATTSLLFSN